MTRYKPRGKAPVTFALDLLGRGARYSSKRARQRRAVIREARQAFEDVNVDLAGRILAANLDVTVEEVIQ